MIYIIEDDTSVLKALSLLLCSAGFNVRAFTSARDFLDQNAISDSDCIILDITMPGINGFGLIERLSSRGIHAKFIIITAHDDPEKRERAIKLHAAAFLTKPVDDQALIDTIKWISHSAEKSIAI